MPATEADLMARLDALGIRTETVRHPPVFTVAEAKALRGALPGGHCKSLFLKDKRGQLVLLVCLEDRALDLKRLDRRLGTARFSFGSPELLREVLGVEPGSVTPFGLINDLGRRVRVVLDRRMLEQDPLNYHPLRNDATTRIRPADLICFIEACGHAPEVVDLDTGHIDCRPLPTTSIVT
jgi:Ala-tRNA(Pro) deacylase